MCRCILQKTGRGMDLNPEMLSAIDRLCVGLVVQCMFQCRVHTLNLQLSVMTHPFWTFHLSANPVNFPTWSIPWLQPKVLGNHDPCILWTELGMEVVVAPAPAVSPRSCSTDCSCDTVPALSCIADRAFFVWCGCF